MQQKTNTSKPVDGLAFSIDTFCRAHDISRPFLYTMWKEGTGPDVMRIGRRVLIPVEAATAWRERMTSKSGEVTHVA
jgi:predicted DNA-binding transcriptional regulator AlpA